jgi:hypothetical protein
MAHDHPFLNLDQRLLVLGTRHDQIISSPADVECNLRNAGTNIKSKIVGISIETAFFNHFMRNVPPKLTQLTFAVFNSDLFPDGTELKVEVPPAQYDIVSFAAALQTGFDAAFGGASVITIAVDNPPGLPQSVSYQLEPPFAIGGLGYITMTRSKNLARVMGVNRGEVFVVTQAAEAKLMPLLSGEPAVYIHSKTLTGSRSSLGGHEVSDSVIGTIPITVPYGLVQSVRMADAERPTVVYGLQTPSQIENVDLSFRDADRDIIDMPAGEIGVTVRCWLHAF